MKKKSDEKPWLKWSNQVSALLPAVVVVTLPIMGLQKTSAQNVQPIYSFPQSPASPQAGLVAGPDGNLYSTTWEGGSNGDGSVFRITTNGILSILYALSPITAQQGTFLTNADGVQPFSAVTLGPDGNWYGTTYGGGSHAYGTVFKLTTNGVFTNLLSFAVTNGANPRAALTLGPDGNLYGTTAEGGANGSGTIFRVTTNGMVTTVHSFTALAADNVTGDETNSEGAEPFAGLTLGTDGDFYGGTIEGGKTGSGTLFKVTTNGALTTLYAFGVSGYNSSGIGATDTNADGMSPIANLTLGTDGNFYGTTHSGGKTGSGTVFEVTTNGTLTTLHTFGAGREIYGVPEIYTNSDGAYPWGALTPGPNGAFYGTTSGGGTNGVGTVFAITTGGTFTSLLTFAKGNGANPGGTLFLTNGLFYGTTAAGGSSGNGTVFAVTPIGVLTTLYNFALGNGASPYAGLTLAPNGNFYGTTYEGGTNGSGADEGPDGDGTFFVATTNGVLTTLACFAGTNGANPEGGLIPGPNGNLYGTTFYGGSNNAGTVFAVTTNGVLTTLASFVGTNGQNPAGSLILGTNGNFYGTTVHGGANAYGTIFEVTTNGILTTLHSFTYGNDGAFPYAGLILGTNGDFYGTSAYGGTDQWGTVFEVTANGGFTTLYSFADGSDGASPMAALTLGPNGNFYGTTSGDDSSTYGCVFEMTPKGVMTSIHSFTDGSDGGSPNAALTLGPDNNFYGTTYGNSSGEPGGGGSNPCGTLFEVTSNGAFSTLVSFAGTNGMYPKGNLILGPDGNFYGTTSDGGADGIGESLSFEPAT